MPDAGQLDVLVVDDEPLARRGMRVLLRDEVGLTRVREAASGAEAIASIRDRRPDLIFLDIHLGSSDGFSVIGAIGAHALPPIIFVTAYDRYALQAFEAHAVDYLLKPVDPDRLRDAVERAATLVRRDDHASLQRALDAAARMIADFRAASVADAGRSEAKVAVRDGKRTVFVLREDITWVQAAGNYINVHTRDETYTRRSTLDAFAAEVGVGFIRVRRSLLVRSAFVQSLSPLGRGTYAITLDDGTRLTSSRYFRDQIAPMVDSPR